MKGWCETPWTAVGASDKGAKEIWGEGSVADIALIGEFLAHLHALGNDRSLRGSDKGAFGFVIAVANAVFCRD